MCTDLFRIIIFKGLTSLALLLFFKKICVCVCVCVCGVHGGQKRVSDPLELELQVVVSRLMWVLVTELRSSTRAARALNTLATSPAPKLVP